MQYHNGILCITHSELTDGILSTYNYDVMKHRGRFQVLRRGCYGTPALVAFDSLPEAVKQKCIDKYGNPRETAATDWFKTYIQYDPQAYLFFSKYILADGRYLPEDVQKTYCINASVLKAIQHIITDRKSLIRALGGNQKHVWDNISATVNTLKQELGHDLPENARRLRNKLLEYNKDSYITLISGKWMNLNASKVINIDQEALLRQLFRKHNNFDNEQIRLLYNTVAENVQWDKLSVSTISNYRKKWNFVTIGARRGEINFDNTIAMQVKRKAPVLPMVYWTADGWEVELLYQKTEIDKNGNSVTTYHNRLVAVVIIDPSNKYPVGYAVGECESPALIREAFRNAVNHTAELFGNRHRVHQLQTDNYSRKKLKPFYEGLSELYTPARVHNAKSKVIEPYFSISMNKKYCQFLPNWSGFGVTSRKENQPNSEYLNKIRHSFPDEQGVRGQIDRIIESQRASKLKKYMEAYEDLPEADRLLMTDAEYLFNLGETHKWTNKLSPKGLIVTLDGMQHDFECFDVRLRENASEDWAIKYDPNDTHKVLAVNAKSDDNSKLQEIIGTLRFELEEKYVQPMALYDRKEYDSDELQRVLGFNKTIKRDILEDMIQDQKIVEGFFNENLQLENTLTKLVLVDSNGQHKDNKSNARLNGRKLLEKQSKKEEQIAEKSWQAEQDEYLKNKVDLDKYL